MRKFICGLTGHNWEPSKQYFLPARICVSCSQRQVLLPNHPSAGINAGQWVNEKKAAKKAKG